MLACCGLGPPVCWACPAIVRIKRVGAVCRASGAAAPRAEAAGGVLGGCLLLSHDAPRLGVRYNSTADLLALLAATPEDVAPLRIALCFKSGAPCEDTPRGRAWLALVDEFFDAAQALVAARRGGALEFVLDGDGKPYDCLVDRWRPWNSTFIDGDRSPPAALFSDDVSLGYDRYQVLNEKEDIDRWTNLSSADVNYGKFSAQRRYA